MKIWLILTQVLMALSLPLWGMALLMSPMAFDSGPSRAATTFIGLLLAYPVMLLVCAVGAWLLYRAGKTTGAGILTSLPIVVVAAGAIVVQIHG